MAFDKMIPGEAEYNAAVFAELEKAQQVFEHWRTYISQKYELTPRDSFTRDGFILRAGQIRPQMVPIMVPTPLEAEQPTQATEEPPAVEAAS